MALAYLSLPRVVCLHPETQLEIKAGIGRYGPFLQYKGGYKSLGVNDDVLTIAEERAIQLVATIGPSRSSQDLAVLGQLEGKNVTVREGRFGPYIRYGSVNAKLPLTYKDMPHECTLDEAVEAIREKHAQEGGGRGEAKKTKAKTAVKEEETKAKRGKSAYLFFCQEKRHELVEQGLGFGDIAKKLSAMWKELSPEDKAPYEEMSNLDKLRLHGSVDSPTKKSKLTKDASSSKHSASKARTSAKSSNASKPKTNEIKRPRSAYLFFCSAHRPALVSQGLSFAEISKKLSEMWKAASAEEREPFEKQARDAKDQYQKAASVQLLQS